MQSSQWEHWEAAADLFLHAEKWEITTVNATWGTLCTKVVRIALGEKTSHCRKKYWVNKKLPKILWDFFFFVVVCFVTGSLPWHCCMCTDELWMSAYFMDWGFPLNVMLKQQHHCNGGSRKLGLKLEWSNWSRTAFCVLPIMFVCIWCCLPVCTVASEASEEFEKRPGRQRLAVTLNFPSACGQALRRLIPLNST